MRKRVPDRSKPPTSADAATRSQDDGGLISRMRGALQLGMRGAPWWWEFESEMKRRLALEMLLRRMFAMVPQSV
jgi:N-glycosylase/DNA lyase